MYAGSLKSLLPDVKFSETARSMEPQTKERSLSPLTLEIPSSPSESASEIHRSQPTIESPPSPSLLAPRPSNYNIVNFARKEMLDESV